MRNGYGAPYIRVYTQNGEITPDIKDFSYKYSQKADDEAQFTIITKDINLPDRPEYQEGSILTLKWGYIGEPQGVIRKVIIRDIKVHYGAEEIALVLLCTDAASRLKANSKKDIHTDTDLQDRANKIANDNGLNPDGDIIIKSPPPPDVISPGIGGVIGGHDIDDAGIAFLKNEEKFRPTKYNDSASNCTIGYGTLIHYGICDGSPSELPYTNGISEADASARLKAYIKANAIPAINRLVLVPLKQNHVNALCSFIYNEGPNAFASSTLLKVLNTGDYLSIPSELAKWNKEIVNGKKQVSVGLTARRARESELWSKTSNIAPTFIAKFSFSYY